MTRQIPFVGGEYYHIYNRGTNKMQIFNSASDYDRFIKLLYLVNSEETIQYSDINKNKIWEIEKGKSLVSIGAWCLMPNHFHILIKVKNDKFASLFIQRLLTSHSKYFNIKYDRSGSLFQGKSKSEHANNDRYLKYLFAYIHLNPVKLIEPKWKEKEIQNSDKIIKFLEEYKYSSYCDYVRNEREEERILDKVEFPEYFNNPKSYIQELKDWLVPMPISDIGMRG